ncbi:MAG: SURF1 family cytochrome oxidase biogenesis protein, partial [Streptosporangiaceae bacterium]
MYRFVLSRRWLGFALFVVVLAGVCVRLGVWQLDRLHERIDQNRVVEQNMSASVVPIDAVQDVPDARRSGEEWQRVRATGTYDTAHQVVVKYQTRDGQPGVEVLTPLVTSSGRAVLVDRGWMQSANNTETITDIPAAPEGSVTVEGWWRPNSTATGNAVEPHQGQVRAISSSGVAGELDYPLYTGYVNLRGQEPDGAGGLEGEPRPDMGQGPHFFYAMQWYFFAALAVFGWFYFAWVEAH